MSEDEAKAIKTCTADIRLILGQQMPKDVEATLRVIDKYAENSNDDLYDQLQELVKKYKKPDPQDIDGPDSLYAYLLETALNEWDTMAWYLGNTLPKLPPKPSKRPPLMFP